MPNFEKMRTSQPPRRQNVSAAILCVFYFLLAISFILVVLRSYVRTRITRELRWGWDDTMIIAAWIFLLIGSVLNNLGTNLGSGQHVAYLDNPEQRALDLSKLNTFYEMVYAICTLLTKISISFYILRIRNTRALRATLVVVMTSMTLATLTLIIALAVSCIPLRKLWEPQVPGKCFSPTVVNTASYVQSGFTIATDLALTATPVFILWNVRITTKRKVQVCGLMSLGLIATVTSALRNAFVKGIHGKDFTWTSVPAGILVILEMSSGIIAACIPACRPIATLWNRKADSTVELNTRTSTSRKSPLRSVTSGAHTESYSRLVESRQ